MIVDSYEDKTEVINWKSFIGNELWFQATLSSNNLEILDTGDQKKAEYLQKILRAAHLLNSKVIVENKCFRIKTNLGFSPEWGFGSSSTLLSNIAYWFGINPFDLHFMISEGSAYDVACARATGPIIYQLEGKNPIIESVLFYPVFHHNLYFVYLGKKQESAQSLKTYQGMLDGRGLEIQKISEITKRMISAQGIQQFENAMDEHEEIMCSILKLPKAREHYFAGYQGSVKSLGAWGGDFVMITWKNDRQSFENEMIARNFNTFFSFAEVALEHNKTI